MAKSVDLTSVSPKVKLMKDITDKLKSPKFSAFTPQVKMTQSQTIVKNTDTFSPKRGESPQEVKIPLMKKNHKL